MSAVVALDMRMAWHSGIGTYVRHLAAGLQASSGGSLDYRFYGPRHLISAVLPGVSDRQSCSWEAPIYGLSEQLRYGLLPRRWDLWHSPHYNAPLIKKGKLVVTVHDLIHLVFAGKYFNRAQEIYARTLLAAVRRNADAVIAVSHHTKKDLIERAGFDAKKITVIHEAADASFCPQSEAAQAALRQKCNLQGPYVLYVGNLKPHKNVSQLVRVFRKLKREKKIEGLLCLAGKMDRELMKADPDLFAAITHDTDTIRYVSPLPTKDLPALYTAASAFVLPSLYEGFGLTVLEAMACGTPVLLSNKSCLPEIAGDAAAYFDTDQDASLADALQNILQDEHNRKHLREAGLKRAKTFSWETMASGTADIYKNVLGF